MELAVITIEDYAKYPFLKQASSKIQNLDLTIQSMVEDPDILDRAEKRVEIAIKDVTIGDRDKDDTKEIVSFAASLILVIATKKPWIKKRYALAVAKIASKEMQRSNYVNDNKRVKEKIFTIAKDFDWKIIDGQKVAKDYGIHFADYLRNSAHIHGNEWKLVNQIIDDGYVYINKDKAARLLQEEIKKRVEKRLEVDEIKNLPEDINLKANTLNILAQEVDF